MPQGVKVFWFFFSKKNKLRHPAEGTPNDAAAKR
jgi:hypothetical protein